MSDFPTIAFQSSLAIVTILFGVFGFLYSVYGLYSTLPTPKNPERAPIVNRLRKVCRFIAGFITFNAAITIYSLCLLYSSGVLSNLNYLILGGGLGVTMLVIAIFSIAWTFRYMD